MKQLVVPFIACGLFFATALYFDLKWRRIPNLLTVPAAVAGILYQALYQGFSVGLLFSLKGLGMGLVLLFIPFILGGMGGSDVKLLAALGCWLGASGVFNLFLYGASIGGGIALVMVVGESGFKGLKNLFLGIALDLAARQRPRVNKELRGIPYSIPMAAGYVVYLLAGPVV